MLPRLQAERALQTIEQVAAATGQLRNPDAYRAQLQAQAAGGRDQRPQRADSMAIAALGIAVIEHQQEREEVMGDG